MTFSDKMMPQSGDLNMHNCKKCNEPKTRYEVKIKNTLKEYWVCWFCYDKQLEKEKLLSEP